MHYLMYARDVREGLLQVERRVPAAAAAMLW